jgi:hypothetical protein
MIFASQQKTHISGLYMTAENHRGIKVTGSNSDGALFFSHMEVEGRNAGAPSNELFRLEGGRVHLTNSWIGYAKNGAYINQTGGELVLNHIDFGKANAFDVSTPVLTQTGGRARVSNITSNWGGNPVVRGANITVDSSVNKS